MPSALVADLLPVADDDPGVGTGRPGVMNSTPDTFADPVGHAVELDIHRPHRVRPPGGRGDQHGVEVPMRSRRRRCKTQAALGGPVPPDHPAGEPSEHTKHADEARDGCPPALRPQPLPRAMPSSTTTSRPASASSCMRAEPPSLAP